MSCSTTYPHLLIYTPPYKIVRVIGCNGVPLASSPQELAAGLPPRARGVGSNKKATVVINYCR
jgi:hypothetical protein